MKPTNEAEEETKDERPQRSKAAPKPKRGVQAAANLKEEDDPLFVRPAKRVVISEYSSIL